MAINDQLESIAQQSSFIDKRIDILVAELEPVLKERPSTAGVPAEPEPENMCSIEGRLFGLTQQLSISSHRLIDLIERLAIRGDDEPCIPDPAQGSGL